MTRELDAQVIWLTMSRRSHEGRACREYTCTRDDGVPIFSARAFNTGRSITCNTAGDAPRTLAVLRRRRSFPLTGAVDILDGAGSRIGGVRRNGTFRDTAGSKGRFRDARSRRAFAAQVTLATVAEALLSGDGDSSIANTSGWVFSLHGQPSGTLSLARPPWAEVVEARRGGLTTRLSAGLASLRGSLRPPRSWRLARSDSPGDAVRPDPRVLVGAALFMIEMSRW